MNLYDVLAGQCTTHFERLFSRRLAGSWKVAELTDMLPMTFRSNGTALIDYRIYGTTEGAGETKNLLEITAESQTINGVTFTVDKQAGTVTATRESASSSDAILAIEIPDEVKGQNVYFSGCPSEGSVNTYNIYALDYTTTLRAPQWDGTTLSVTDYGTSNNNEVRFIEEHRSQIRLCVKARYDAQNLVFKPMLRRAETTPDFEPFGYKIPLDIRHKTKNLVRATVGTISNGVTFIVDSATGTVTANGTATGTAQLRITINNPDDPNNTNVPSGNYYYSGCPSGGSDSKYNCYSWDNDTGARSKKWDGTTNVEQDNGQGSCQVQINGHRQSIILRIASGYTANNVVFKPMLRAPDTTPDFEPYYLINHEDIYIGDSKLLSDDYIDYESGKIVRNGTPQDPPLPLPAIETFKGENTLDSTETLGQVTIKGKIKPQS